MAHDLALELVPEVDGALGKAVGDLLTSDIGHGAVPLRLGCEVAPNDDHRIDSHRKSDSGVEVSFQGLRGPSHSLGEIRNDVLVPRLVDTPDVEPCAVDPDLVFQQFGVE